MAKRGDLAVRVTGLEETAKALRSIEPAAARELSAAMRVIARDVAATAKGLAPHRTGRLEESIKGGATANKAVVYSALPYAPVHEWGGTIAPHGATIHIKASRFLRGAIDRDRGDIAHRVEDAVQKTVEAHGFTTT